MVSATSSEGCIVNACIAFDLVTLGWHITHSKHNYDLCSVQTMSVGGIKKGT